MLKIIRFLNHILSESPLSGPVYFFFLQVQHFHYVMALLETIKHEYRAPGKARLKITKMFILPE